MTNSSSPLGSLHMPRSLADAVDVSIMLERYTDENYTFVLLMVVVLYVVLQTFCIPGTAFINVVCGCVFGVAVALPVCTIAGALGAQSCFYLSAYFGQSLIKRIAPQRINAFASAVHTNRDDLLYYLLFLRVSPILPNWLINVASPAVGVPAWPFFVATLLGILPATYLAVSLGHAVHLMGHAQPDQPIITPGMSLMLLLGGGVCLLPIAVKKYCFVQPGDDVAAVKGTLSSPTQSLGGDLDRGGATASSGGDVGDEMAVGIALPGTGSSTVAARSGTTSDGRMMDARGA